MRVLRIAAVVEAVSLVFLLVNVFTVHVGVITSLGGPTHGTAYLVIIVIAWRTPPALAPGARPRALVPGIGGLLVLRRMPQEASAARRPRLVEEE
ncbi:DUF3817 domain-containing protein [Streptomyces buecherae]|uniref:DUF3817 domain-containing protein n=1 Tax=Streptomyces buecherae TaxID=2763006 RepID=A0A7H8NKS7_9ACTN|nr:hypothetical protein [Streptomyces buecherae]QKW54048.1 hypothetical protein HUT08_35810 [Streptomyces buecherae]